MRIANQDGREYVKRRQIFRGSHTFSEEKNGVYAVYSYGYHFPMYAWIKGVWFANKDKYSQSTSRQQSQMRPWSVPELIYLNTKELQNLINNPDEADYIPFYQKLGVPI